MQGVWYQMPSGLSRLPSKKALKDQAKAHPETITLEATSVFGNEPDGPAMYMAVGESASVVGPDPYTKRSWYATITRTTDGLKVS